MDTPTNPPTDTPQAAGPQAPLTMADLERLKREHSPEARLDIAEKLGASYRNGTLSPHERKLADQIFRLLMGDAEVRVRQALSQNVKDSPDLPHDIALKLAQDMADVSTPMLEYSMVLTEEDLIEIVRSTGVVTIMSAIARRQSVSAELSDALLNKKEYDVWQTLFANQGAVLREETINEMMDDVKGEDSLLTLLIQRGDLSLRLAEKLFAVVSDEVKKLLTERYRLTLQLAEDNAEEVFELMTLGLVETETEARSIEDLVDHLYATERLSFSLIVRILCAGKMRFFESAMAKIADVPLLHARILILDPGLLGFKSLYDQSGLPQGFYPAVKALLEVALEETQQGRYSRSDYSQRMIEHVTAKGYDRKVEYLDVLTSAVKKSMQDDRPHA